MSFYIRDENHRKKMSAALKGKNKGKKRTAEQIEAHRKLIIGQKRTAEQCKRLSEALKGKKKRPMSAEGRKSKSLVSKKNWLNPIYRNKVMISRSIMQKQAFCDTSIERKIQQELSNRGYGYYLYFRMKGRPDIAFPDQKIAIFCDGNYWHANPSMFKEDDILMKGKIAKDCWNRDNQINEMLESKGWKVLRYWEKEIKENTEAVVDDIESHLFAVANKNQGGN